MKTLGHVLVAVILVSSACNSANSTTSALTGPTPPTTLPVPVPTGDLSGRIANLDTAADLVTYNQAANIGLSIPFEGAIQRTSGIITVDGNTVAPADLNQVRPQVHKVLVDFGSVGRLSRLWLRLASKTLR